jgi:hypothetical protein
MREHFDKESSNKNLFNRLVGTNNESDIEVNGIVTKGLIDTGSQITTVTAEFHSSLTPIPVMKSLEDFSLEVSVANGEKLPYLGYIELEVKVPAWNSQVFYTLALVVPKTIGNVPVIIGTNFLRQLKQDLDILEVSPSMPDAWDLALKSISSESVGVVKSTKSCTLQPFESKVITGFVRKTGIHETVVTEPSPQGFSSKVTVCPRVVTLGNPGKSSRVPVRLFNMSAKVVTIPEKANLCDLHEVKVLRSPVIGNENIAPVHQQSTSGKETNDKEVIEGIDLSDTNLTEKEKEEAYNFLAKWEHVFSKNIKDLGSCNLSKHNIVLENEEPFKDPHRRIPPALFQEVREHLKEMLEAGAIRESTSPFSSNVVIVRKKDGSIRFCVDYRKLNNRTKKDAYAIPRIEDTLHLLAGSKYFSKLDLRSGYWQIEINEPDKQKTAFQAGNLGFYEFNRMPFGLCNAPATFQRVMERCMGDLNLRDCLIYLDDVIIFSTSFSEHLKRLDAVFTHLEEHNLKLKASKCEFFKSKVTYLGHVVSEKGIETDPDKIEAVKTWPVPSTVKEVRAFLGFVGYYRRFVKGFASIARPLNDLLVENEAQNPNKVKSRKAPFVWGETQQHAFEQLKDAITNPPVLAYADYSKPFVVHTDASGTGLGAILYQEQDGLQRVVAYASRSLKPAEKNYPAHKLEFLALKWALCDKFHDYLYGTSFDVVTDNNPLLYVFTTAKLDATGHRWIAELANYNCRIHYRSGKLNTDADGLSRRFTYSAGNEEILLFPEVLKTLEPTNDLLSKTEDHIISHMVVSVVAETLSHNDPIGETVLIPSKDTATSLSIGDDVPEDLITASALKGYDWVKAQQTDIGIRTVIEMMQQPKLPSLKEAKSSEVNMSLFRDIDKLFLRDQVLYRKGFIRGETYNQLVLPKFLIDVVFQAYHSDLGHQGRDRTLSLIKSRFYWPGIDNDIRTLVQQCGRCIRRKTAPPIAAKLVPISTSAPMELVCIDYLTVDRSKGGYENILVVCDHFTRYSLAIPTRNQTASTTAKALYDNVFVHYGFPSKLHSDRGQNFESKVIQKLCDMVGMKKSRTTPYHPMCNGKVERFNQTLMNMIGTLEMEKKSDWRAYISTLTHAYNATIHDSTGFSPFYLMFGRHPRLAVDAFLGLSVSENEPCTSSVYMKQLREKLSKAYEIAGKEAARKGSAYKNIYDKKVRFASIQPGDRVLVQNVGLRGRQKLADIWEENVYVVLRQPNVDIPVFEVQKEHSPTSRVRTLHRNLLLPFFCLPSPVTNVDETSTDENSYVSDNADNSSEESDVSDHLESTVRPRRIIKAPSRLACHDFREGFK